MKHGVIKLIKISNPTTNIENDKTEQKDSSLHAIHRNINLKNKNNISLSIVNDLYNQSPIGLTWDNIDYSCAYDSLFTVLYHIWNEGQLYHKAYFQNGTQYLQLLYINFHSLLANQNTLEKTCDKLRTILNKKKPLQYQFGKNYTNLDELIREITREESCGSSHLQCLNWNFTVLKPYSYLQAYTAVGWCSSDYEKLQHKATIQQYLNYKIIKKLEQTNKTCPSCFRSEKKKISLHTTQYINELPAILIFALAPWIDLNISLTFNVSGCSKKINLKRIIYNNGNHFTARLIDKKFIVWYHNGQTTHSLCQREMFLMQENINQLKTYGQQYKAIMTFYAEDLK